MSSYGLTYRSTYVLPYLYRFKICSNFHVHENNTNTKNQLLSPSNLFLFERKIYIFPTVAPPKQMQTLIVSVVDASTSNVWKMLFHESLYPRVFERLNRNFRGDKIAMVRNLRK